MVLDYCIAYVSVVTISCESPRTYDRVVITPILPTNIVPTNIA